MSSRHAAHEIGSPWPARFFGRLYGEIYREHLLAPAQSRREAAFAARVLGLRGRRVLDVAAGFGRHAVLLAQRNKVAALDLNAAYLAMARRELKDPARGNLALVRGDMMRLPVAPGAFDAVLLLFNSFGYCDGHGGRCEADGGHGKNTRWNARTDSNLVVLTEAARVLKSGGAMLIELPNSAPVIEAVAAAPRRRMAAASYQIEEEFTYDTSSCVLSNRTIFRKGSETETAGYHLRLYKRREAEAILRAAGFSVAAIYGDYAGGSFQADESPMMLIHAHLLNSKKVATMTCAVQ
ncbi:MAG: class I SAM-dependent methyltransferase [bacterium]|nr:class I SAM-dependent methyltransferase [Candidatus Sumerlaeota bacterium]